MADVIVGAVQVLGALMLLGTGFLFDRLRRKQTPNA